MAARKHKIIRTRGQRIAWTNTSRIPDKELIAAIKFVAQEIDLDKTVIHFKKLGERSARYGRAYPVIPGIASLEGLERREWRYLIVATDHFHKHVSSGVMNTLAHEAKHVEQFRRGTLYREKRNRNCEPQARAFGKWIADRWSEATDKIAA